MFRTWVSKKEWGSDNQNNAGKDKKHVENVDNFDGFQKFVSSRRKTDFA